MPPVGYALDSTDGERAGVFLTTALTRTCSRVLELALYAERDVLLAEQGASSILALEVVARRLDDLRGDPLRNDTTPSSSPITMSPGSTRTPAQTTGTFTAPWSRPAG